MNTFLSDVRDTLIPGRDARHGPLPSLLIIMTIVTGLVDTFSFLRLGHVFVANATGNILFLGFALAHVPGFSATESLLALVAFMIGASIGGKLSSLLGHHRGRLFSIAAAVQALLLVIALVLSLFATSPVGGGLRSSLVGVLGLAMGLQNAVARRLAVPDLTTTVLTLTITGMGADSTFVGGTGSKAGRRLVSIAAMLIGAVLGALLVLHTTLCTPLIGAAVAVLVVAGLAATTGRSKDEWTKA
jgi:uncharacterized membrane protein YoaK (UPF0700 family)